MLFSVLPAPSGQHFSVFYILINGSDTTGCGGSANSACFSVIHVLEKYYAEPPTMGLEIRTDKSLEIDDSVVVSKKFISCQQYNGNSDKLFGG